MTESETIIIEFDADSGDYFSVWNPPAALGAGKTPIEALDDMRAAVHLCVDMLLDQKMKDLQKE
jgi:predicted RNase H-like HicB family nuclease